MVLEGCPGIWGGETPAFIQNGMYGKMDDRWLDQILELTTTYFASQLYSVIFIVSLKTSQPVPHCQQLSKYEETNLFHSLSFYCMK